MDENTGGPGPPLENSMEMAPLKNMQENNEENRYDFNNRYRESDQGPYYVYMEHKNKNLGRLFPVKIGHFLQEINDFKRDILDIKSVGIKRVKVMFNSHNVANLLIQHEVVIKNDLIAYIPKFYTQKRGVIKTVDTFFTEEYLKNAINSDIPVVEVKRMKRKNINPQTNNIEYIDRQIIIVTFLGNKLPDSVIINMVRFSVDPYIHPVVQCFKCLRYGHTITQCKGSRRCKKCAQEHAEQEQCDTDKFLCVHCNSEEHSSISKECPTYNKQYNIKKIMAFENTNFKEAEALLNNPSYSKVVTNNRFSLLKNVINFPELTKPSSPNNSIIIRKPRVQTQSIVSKSPYPKKRKVISPPPSPLPTTSAVGRSPRPNHSILPNPHQEEFRQHREQLVSQIFSFVDNLIKNPKLATQANIRDHITSIFRNIKNSSDINIISDDDDSTY